MRRRARRMLTYIQTHASIPLIFTLFLLLLLFSLLRSERRSTSSCMCLRVSVYVPLMYVCMYECVCMIANGKRIASYKNTHLKSKSVHSRQYKRTHIPNKRSDTILFVILIMKCLKETYYSGSRNVNRRHALLSGILVGRASPEIIVSFTVLAFCTMLFTKVCVHNIHIVESSAVSVSPNIYKTHELAATPMQQTAEVTVTKDDYCLNYSIAAVSLQILYPCYIQWVSPMF